jgi:competence protein ComEC
MRRLLLLAVSICVSCQAPSPGAGRTNYGTPVWQRDCLEIHHIDAGRGVATLIISPAGRTLLVDTGEGEWDSNEGAIAVGTYLRSLGVTRLDYVLISHFHLDHVGYPGRGGLWHLVHAQGFKVGRTLHRDLWNYSGEAGGTLARWREYLSGVGVDELHPQIVRVGDGQVDLGHGVVVRILAVDGNGMLSVGDKTGDVAPPSENDYSVAALLRFGRLDYLTAGDLSGETLVSPDGYSYHDMEIGLAAAARDVDVYRVSHHGSDHSSGSVLLAQMQPRVAILQVEDDNAEGHPRQATLDRLAATGASLFLTHAGAPDRELHGGRVVGSIVVRSRDGETFTVNDAAFRATDPARRDADGDGFFADADPDDGAAAVVPGPRGGCDPTYQLCK